MGRDLRATLPDAVWFFAAILFAVVLFPAHAGGSFSIEATYLSSDSAFVPPDNLVAVRSNYLIQDSSGSVVVIGISGVGDNANLDALYLAENGDLVFSLDTAINLNGTLYSSADLIRVGGSGFTMEFDASAEGVADGANLDAAAPSGGGILMSFDIDVMVGGVTADDTDVLEFSGGQWSVFYDASAAGLDASLDLDALHYDAVFDQMYFSFDGSGEIQGLAFDDEDVVVTERDLGAMATWNLHFDGSGFSGLAAVDLDAWHQIINHPPTLADADFQISEFAQVNDLVGTVVATDPDGDIPATGAFAIIAGDAGNNFRITNTGRIRVNDTTGLMPSVFTLTVEVTDAAGLTDTATVTITVVDEGSPPVVSDASFNIPETAAVDDIVGQVVATDPDDDIPLTGAYQITAGDANNNFRIGDDGTIRVDDTAGFTPSAVFSLTVEVTDAAGLSDTATVTITVTNVDRAPVINDASFQIFDSAGNGDIVGRMSVGDPDGDIPVSGAFQITGGNSAGIFGINDDGEIFVADASAIAPDTIILTISVTDSAGLSDTATATIEILASPSASEIAVERKGSGISDGSTDTVVSGVGPVSLVYKIRNPGQAALSVSNPVLTNPTNVSDLRVSKAPASSVASGGSTSFTVSFTVDSASPYGFDIRIGNNDDDEDPFDIQVAGTVTAVELEAELQGTLLVDNDGDGSPNPSDTIRFVVSLSNSGEDLQSDLSFELDAPANSTIRLKRFDQQVQNDITILRNDAGGFSVVINDLLLRTLAGFSSLFEFDLTVGNDALPDSKLFVQGRFGFEEVTVLTDDPMTGAVMDPTVLTIGRLGRLIAPEDASQFGQASAIGDGVAVIGSPGNSGGDGSVFIYRVGTDGSRTLASRIDAPSGFAGSNFGAALALEGRILGVGAPLADKVAIYGIDDLESPELLGEVANPDGLGGSFGAALIIEADVLVIGAPDAPADNNGLGKAFVYALSDIIGTAAKGTPVPTVLQAKAANATGRFGAALGMSNGKIAVGIPGPFGGQSPGVLDVFNAIGDNLASVPAPVGVTEFGAAIDMEGDMVLIGAPTQNLQGAAFVYDTNNFSAPMQQFSVGSSGGFDFGRSVAMGEGEIFVGAPNAAAADVVGTTNAGAVYQFDPGGILMRTIGAFAEAPDDETLQQQSSFGTSLAEEGGALLIGAPASQNSRGAAAIRVKAPDSIFDSGFEDF